MPVQTTVTYDMPNGFPGTIRSSTRIMTVRNTEETEEIPFGVGVVQNTAAEYLQNRQAALLPSSAADAANFLGVSTREPISTRDLGANELGPKPGQFQTVGYDGEVLVRVETAVVKGAKAFMRFATGAGGTQRGAFRADEDTATAVELAGCTFAHSGAAGSLVWLRVDDAVTRAGV